MTDRPLVIVSNRGPLSFSVDEAGELRARRGAGGLVSGIGPLVSGTSATWVAAALSDADRSAGSRGRIEAEGFGVRTLALDPDRYRASYDVICNATLWFVHHALYDLPRRPRFDARWRDAWDAYRAVNQAFADVVADEAAEEAVVLVQDYHLYLVGESLRAQRADLDVVHFSHTPFASPDLYRVLPDGPAHEILEGMAAHRACGFHTRRWATAFEATTRAAGLEPPATFVAPLAPDPDDIGGVAASSACESAVAELDALLGDRRFVVRVDRIEPSKNLLRGFHAFDELLERHPRWRGEVVFGAFVYPSREGLPDYLAYRQEVEGLARHVNRRWGTEEWTPVLLDTSDDFPRSVAALRRYDALLVNPVLDGLNLVAKEGPLVNERDGVLLLSTEAGAWEELGDVAVGVNPFDVAATADALADVLAWPSERRRDHAAAVAAAAGARSPRDWLDDLLGAAEA